MVSGDGDNDSDRARTKYDRRLWFPNETKFYVAVAAQKIDAGKSSNHFLMKKKKCSQVTMCYCGFTLGAYACDTDVYRKRIAAICISHRRHRRHRRRHHLCNVCCFFPNNNNNNLCTFIRMS